MAVLVRQALFWNCFLGVRTRHLPPWGEVAVFVVAAPSPLMPLLAAIVPPFHARLGDQ